MAGCREENRLVDEEFIVKLSSFIGLKWMTIGRLLKISNVKLEVMRANNPGNQEEAVFQMLSHWRQESGLHATYEVLGKALHDAKRHDLAACVCKGQLPEEPHTTTVPVFDILKHLKKDLEWFYINKLCKVPVSPWGGQKISIGDIYTNVQLLMNSPGPQEGHLQVPLESHHQLFSVESKQRYGSRSILRGKAGSGKSTTVARLAYDWAKKDQNSPLTNYDILFVLQMRSMSPSQSLGDAIISQLLPRDSPYTKENVEKFVKENEENLAIIFDGYDEYSYPANTGSPHYVLDIFQGDRMRHCCILVTMRPWKALESKELCDYTVYEVKGFSPQNVDHYIMEKSFSHQPEVGRQLVNYLEVNNLKESIGCIPLLTSLLCDLWRSDPKMLDKPPTSLGQLFNCLCSCFRTRGQESLSSSSEDDLPEGDGDHDNDADTDEVESLLVALGPTALDGLFREQQELTFSYPSLRETLGKEILKTGKETGLLMFEERLSFSPSTSKSSKRRRKKEKRVSFYHKNIQEYCAGVHLAWLQETNMAKFQECIDSINSIVRVLDLSYVLLFASWKSPDAAKMILDMVSKVFQKELEPMAGGFFDGSLGLRDCHRMQKYFELCLHINYESQSAGALNRQLQCVHPRGSIRLVGISSYSSEALAYYLKYLQDATATENKYQRLVSLELIQLSMKSTTSIRELGRHFPSAEELHTSYMQVYTRKEPEELDHLRTACMSKVSKSVPEMNHWNNYEFVSKYHLVQILEDWQSSRTDLRPVVASIAGLQLSKLTLAGQDLSGSVDLLRIALESDNLSNLKYLNLSHCQMAEEETEILAVALTNLRELEELNMASNHLGAVFGEELAKLSKITVLVLERTQHTAEVAEKFVKAFENLTHLTYLEFRHNIIDDAGGRILISSLGQLQDLQNFRISSSNMSLEVFSGLIRTIGKLRKLKNLQILHIPQPNILLPLLADVLFGLTEIEDFRISGFKDLDGNYMEVKEAETMKLVHNACKLEHLRMFSVLQVKMSLPLVSAMVDCFAECKSNNFEVLRITQKLITCRDAGNPLKDVKFLRLW